MALIPRVYFLYFQADVSVCSTGGRDGGGVGGQVRSEEVDVDRATPQGPDRQAVSGALAQSPEPQHQEDGVDRGGGPHHLQCAQAVGQPVGQDRQAASGKVTFSLISHTVSYSTNCFS